MVDLLLRRQYDTPYHRFVYVSFQAEGRHQSIKIPKGFENL
jgi:hypothetical protein